jgi:hypothetical protein
MQAKEFSVKVILLFNSIISQFGLSSCEVQSAQFEQVQTAPLTSLGNTDIKKTTKINKRPVFKIVFLKELLLFLPSFDIFFPLNTEAFGVFKFYR